MRIKLAYGKAGLEINLPDDLNVTVLEPKFIPGVLEPSHAIRQALRNPIESEPLRDLVGVEDKVGIVFNDITRPTPNNLILGAVIGELAHVPIENITLFNALGTHRPNTDAELRSMLGDSLVNDFRIVQNNAFEPSTQDHLGVTSRGHEIWLNRELMECDVKVLTGFIEPHFFAGFSGGGKALMPGMAGLRTILGNHDAGMIANSKSTWGVTHGNPIWEEVQEVAGKATGAFLVNVTLNRGKRVTGVYAGNLGAAHSAGCDFVRGTAMVQTEQAFNIVITTNSGYPLDLNLYQTVKGMSAASQIVQKGGAIIVAADCWDGVPDHGLYGKLLREARTPQALLERICSPGFLEQDQWQAQIQAQIQLEAQVFVRSDHLTDEEIEAAMLKPCHRIEETVTSLLTDIGRSASICVLPEGPQTVPYIQP